MDVWSTNIDTDFLARYPGLAAQTLARPHSDPNMVTVHSIMGIVTELRELEELVKKEQMDNSFKDDVNAMEEFGDVCWFIAVYCHECGIPFSSLMGYPAFSPYDRIMQDRWDIVFDDTRDAAVKLLDMCKAYLFYQRPLNYGSITAYYELILRNIWKLTARRHLNFTDILATNIQKLQRRFPDKFTADAANNRDLKAERAVLEDAHASVTGKGFTIAHALGITDQADSKPGAQLGAVEYLGEFNPGKKSE